MAKRKVAIGRAGNYAAPVDTAGMDPEMRRTLGIGVKRPAKPMGMLERLRAKAGKKAK